MSGDSLSTDETLHLLEKPKEIAICGHVNPDGDALGSGLALAAFLRMKGHRVTCLLAKQEKPPELYRFLDHYDLMPAAEYDLAPDLFIAMDLPVKNRLGDAIEVFDRAAETLVIDHHPDYSGFADHYYGDATASATGMLVWKLIKASDVVPTKEMAEYCYVALITDTGRFSFQNTTTESFMMAAEMVTAGVDPSKTSALVYDSVSLNALKLDARLISRISFAAGGRFVFSWVTEEDFDELQLSRDESEGLPTILRSVKGAEVAALLREEGERIRVNLRAKGCCDVGSIARHFGGGGHQAAAGFTLTASLEEARDLIVEEVDSIVA